MPIEEMPLQIEQDYEEFFDSDSFIKCFYSVISDVFKYDLPTLFFQHLEFNITEFSCSFRQRGGDD